MKKRTRLDYSLGTLKHQTEKAKKRKQKEQQREMYARSLKTLREARSESR